LTNYKSDSETIETQKDSQLAIEEICSKFTALCELDPTKVINLKSCGKVMEVEEKRLLDIVNAMIGIRAIKRLNKSTYLWKGFNRIYRFTQNLEVRWEVKIRRRKVKL
jgi:hypothetical protein